MVNILGTEIATHIKTNNVRTSIAMQLLSHKIKAQRVVKIEIIDGKITINQFVSLKERVANFVEMPITLQEWVKNKEIKSKSNHDKQILINSIVL